MKGLNVEMVTQRAETEKWLHEGLGWRNSYMVGWGGKNKNGYIKGWDGEMVT